MENFYINEINNILLTEWDPIGIRHIDGAHDEYLQYANEIYEIIQRSNSDNELFDYLWKLETHHMGLKGNRTKTKKMAQTIFSKIKK